MKSIGLDIGTTTICGVLYDVTKGEMIRKKTLPNNAAISCVEVWQKQQDVNVIMESCNEIIELFIQEYTDIDYIGVTGQMHGILYVNQHGEAVTPLITWQDGSGNQAFNEQETYSSYIQKNTGHTMATGYGLVTHLYYQRNDKIPKDAVTFCTIADYIAMTLTGIKAPLLHKSMAASLGCFLVDEGHFDEKALEGCGINPCFLPKVAQKESILGLYNDKVQVSVALGDNQASFLGSVSYESNILINIGTGSQISVFTDQYDPEIALEYRPYLADTYLIVGSALCGGDAYALLKNFYIQVLEMFGFKPGNDIYELMNQEAQKAEKMGNKVKVDTCFNGTRMDPKVRGGIHKLGTENFTTEHISFGILQGICDELYQIFNELPTILKKAKKIIGSGNGIRKNPVLQRICSQTYGKELVVARYEEEAAYGSGLFALYCAGYFKDIKEIQCLIGSIKEEFE